jgi:hypothetical protein
MRKEVHLKPNLNVVRLHSQQALCKYDKHLSVKLGLSLLLSDELRIPQELSQLNMISADPRFQELKLELATCNEVFCHNFK